ncbi:MAG TPA: hypothetical protein ENH87_11190 [Pricia antarctica]|uniref:Uncharacterized protein n=1 Tax=Pricia antarctica TaxID=641691 RepID=A0A831QRQ4_9FLAO|nr:hypothetical protein [Pricia antarctica]
MSKVFAKKRNGNGKVVVVNNTVDTLDNMLNTIVRDYVQRIDKGAVKRAMQKEVFAQLNSRTKDITVVQ